MTALSSYFPTVDERFSPEQVREYYESGVWFEDSFYAQTRAQATKQPDKVAFFDSTTSLTYGQFREQVLRLAAGLKRLGVERGDVLQLAPSISAAMP